MPFTPWGRMAGMLAPFAGVSASLLAELHELAWPADRRATSDVALGVPPKSQPYEGMTTWSTPS
jgi:hypothetical protein